MADPISTPQVSQVDLPNGGSAVSTDFLQALACECDAMENSIQETDAQTNNKGTDSSPMHAPDHFDPTPAGAKFFLDAGVSTIKFDDFGPTWRCMPV